MKRDLEETWGADGCVYGFGGDGFMVYIYPQNH